MSRTRTGNLSRMSEDEDAVTIDVEGRAVRITHPDKPYFTRGVQLTKRDIVDYYLAVAPGARRADPRPADRAQALRRRRRRPALLPEASPVEAARTGSER